MALGTQIRDLVDALGELLAQHLRLARMELAEDARYVGVRVALMAAFAALVLFGYGFLCIALALALGRVMRAEIAFLLVGALNLLMGGLGLAGVQRQLARRAVMNASLEELESSSAVLAHVERPS